MTRNSPPAAAEADSVATAKALKLIERQLERNAFEIDANKRAQTASLDRHVELSQVRKELILLYRMSGGVPAEYAPESRASG